MTDWSELSVQGVTTRGFADSNDGAGSGTYRKVTHPSLSAGAAAAVQPAAAAAAAHHAVAAAGAAKRVAAAQGRRCGLGPHVPPAAAAAAAAVELLQEQRHKPQPGVVASAGPSAAGTRHHGVCAMKLSSRTSSRATKQQLTISTASELMISSEFKVSIDRHSHTR